LQYRPPPRVMLVSADAELALGVARCFARTRPPDAVVAAPSVSVRLSCRVGRTHEVPAAWFAGDPRRLAELLRRLCAPAEGWVALPVDCRAHVQLARTAGIRTVALAPPRLLRHLDSKAWLAGFARDAGLPVPATLVLRGPVLPGGVSLRCPLIVKPAIGSGGRGVRRIESESDLVAHIRAEQPCRAKPLIVQQYVEGDDVGVSVLAERGRVLVLAVQRHLPRRELRFERNPAAEEIARHFVSATGYTGVAHLDFIEPPGSRCPLLLECNPRFWASVDAACRAGINFPALAVQRVLGEGVAWPAAPPVADVPRTVAADRFGDPLPWLCSRWANLVRHAAPRARPHSPGAGPAGAY
jgi:hypothetical protein